jgi:O-antigen/teichoic acid export membrane protein
VGVANLKAERRPPKRRSVDVADVLDTSEAGGRIVRGGLFRFVSYVAVVGLSIVPAALLTRHLGVGLFGQYTTVVSLVAVVASVADAGMSTIGTREFAVREGSERDALMRDLLGLRISLSLVGVIFAAAFAVALGYSTPLLLGAVLAGLGTVALVIQHTYTIPLATALRLGVLSSLELVRQLLTVVAIVALVLLGAGVLPLLSVPLLVSLLLIAPTARLARHAISLRASLRPHRWVPLLKLTVSFWLATAVGTVYVYTAQVITSVVSSSHQSGLFAASFRIFIVVSAVPGLLVGGALPLLARAARDDRERLAYALSRIFEVSLILGVAAALTLLAAAPFIISVIAGARFAGAVTVLQIQSAATVASFLLAGWSYALLSMKRYRAILTANGAAVAVSLALTIILAATHGARGAALATLAGESTLAIGLVLALVRASAALRPPVAVVYKVVLAAVPAVALALIPNVPSPVSALLALSVYGIVIVLTRAVPAELRELAPWIGRNDHIDAGSHPS